MSIHDRPIWAAGGRKSAAVRNPQIQTAGIGPVPGACQLRFAPGTNVHTWDAVSCLRFLGLELPPGGLPRTARPRFQNVPTRRISGERRATVCLFCHADGLAGCRHPAKGTYGCILLWLNDQPNQAPHCQALALGGNAQPLGLHRVDEPNASNPGAAQPRNSNWQGQLDLQLSACPHRWCPGP